MTLTDELKNLAQYDLNREAAKVSALSSKDLRKYEDLTGEDLVCKPGVVEQAKFEYSPLGEIFNKELKKEDEKKGVKNVKKF